MEIDPINEDTAIFVWRGVVQSPMAQSFAGEFERRKEEVKRIVIELNSSGGDVGEGERVINVIKDMKRTHSVQTYVGPESECLSMCVPIYLQGRLRVAATSSQWMFHRPSAYDPLTGQNAISYGTEKSQATLSIYNRFFKDSPMNPMWRESLRQQWEFGDVWKTGKELKAERSNIIMVLEE